MKFRDLEGKIISSIRTNIDLDSLEIHCEGDEYFYTMGIFREAEEQGGIADIHGDLNDVVGSPILEAVEAKSGPLNEYSETHFFYHLRTHKRSICIRWFVGSSGYYAPQVSFCCHRETQNVL